MDYVLEFPLSHIDRRPRKRPRFTWDPRQPHPKAQSGIYYEQDVGSGTSFGPTRVLPDRPSLLLKKDLPRGEMMTKMDITYETFTSRPPKDGTGYKRLPKSSAIKVIDFGSTAYECQEHNYIVSTRHYPAPEDLDGVIHVTLECWLHLGRVLFGSNATSHVEKSRGQITFVRLYSSLSPLPLLHSWFSRHTEKYVRRGRLDWPEGATPRESIKAVLKLHRLQNLNSISECATFIDIYRSTRQIHVELGLQSIQDVD
ncbi:serine/threonine-protein kinase AFC2-like [Pyrus ussuriensis x Pyrus communis]|uniref:Serine/threonine-protein kinase AFC2-like n=1 Tax=Pyrus ussuriensis x Pyrus communis TaxID=2448454 RepID=A0A5N5G262_9ROSA|nr:serine/threonine-protein kinase AFC2-like [Pyrus ussuriensis x Pyrus communis]